MLLSIIALLAAQTASHEVSEEAARSDLPAIDCLFLVDEGALAQQFVDMAIANDFEYVPSAKQQQQMDQATQGCVDENKIDAAELELYMLASFSYMMSSELKQRILEAGFDFSAIESLLVVENENPDFDIVKYVDDRPEEFRDPIERVSAKLGLETGEFESWIRSYVEFYAIVQENSAKLNALRTMP